MADIIRVRIEELEGDDNNRDVYLTVPRAAVGHAEVGQTLSASPIDSGIPGLKFLTVTYDPNTGHQATVEELMGDADTATVYVNTPREMLGDEVAPGTEYDAVLTAKADGTPVLVVFVQA